MDVARHAEVSRSVMVVQAQLEEMRKICPVL